jgi:hypothetical protein
MLQVTNTFTVEDMRRFDLREMLGAFMRAIAFSPIGAPLAHGAHYPPP